MSRLSEQEFRRKVTIVSMLLSIMIVCFHAHNLSVYTFKAEDGILERFTVCLENILHNIEEIGVPFFFLISGYLFFRNYTLKDTLKKWKSRIFTVLIPFLLWGTLYWLYYLFLTNFPLTSPYMNMSDIEFSLIGWARVTLAHSHTVFWYLHTLIFYIILTPAMYVVLKNRRKLWTGLVILGIVLCMCSDIIPVSWTGFGGGFFPKRLYTVGYFMTGAYVAINHKEIAFYKSKKITLLGVIGGILCAVLIQFLPERGVLLTCFCITVWFAMNIFSYEKEVKWYMQISFFVYCTHSAVLEAIEKIFLIVGGGDSAFWALADYLIAPVIALVIIFGLAWIMKNKLFKIWKVLNGGRGY